MNSFARLYDRLSFDIPYGEMGKRIRGILKDQNIDPKRVLEFGGGTGNLTQYLYQEGMVYDFVDVDREMLEIASSKFGGKLHYYHCDIGEFPISGKYDLIIGNLNVVNYLDKKTLEKLFPRFQRALSPGGIFFFDINSPYKLKEIQGNHSFIYEKDEIFYTWINELGKDYIDYYLDFFVEEENGLYRRCSEDFTEYIYTIDDMEKLLKESGFSFVKSLDYDKGGPVSDDSLRILFQSNNEY
ncbi:MAG: class I SAM-dependent methyltransferase [Tissierellia bacterium]|nr:class I SAM-dependent methyltransferase [Tissierellia bacterium]